LEKLLLKKQITVAEFLFSVIFLFLWLCASVIPLGHVLLQRLGVIGIFPILIYTLIEKRSKQKYTLLKKG
jgi:hypothetical protein